MSTDQTVRTQHASMQALVYQAPRVMTMCDVDVPAVGPDDVLIAVEYSGICGSELSGFLGESSIRRPPLVFGHEVSGRVAAVGAAVDGRFAVGDVVTANPLVTCGRCRYCVSGRQQLCARRLLLGASLPGSNAQFVRVPQDAVVPLPAGMDLATGAMVEPVAFALRAVEVSGATPASSALVIGAGAIGLLIAQVLGAGGVTRRYVVERNPERLARAVESGCVPVMAAEGELPDVVRDLTDGGVEVAFDAVGVATTRRDCLLALAPGGTMVLAGLHSDETALPLNTAIRSELTIAGAFAYTPRHFATGLDWLATGRVGLRAGVVEAPLADGQRWFDRLVSGDPAAKVLLRPDPTDGLPR